MNEGEGELPRKHKLAAYYEKENGKVRCRLCPNSCLVAAEEAGRCRVRVHEDGELVTNSYGVISALALDPMEKKPLYHFYPGKTILSLGSFGCNLRCLFCQNWQISQTMGRARTMTPEQVVQYAKEYRRLDCVGVAFTYNEPAIWYEFIADTVPLIKAAGLVTVLVTNGYISPKPWLELLAYIDAVNVDIKGWSDKFYHELCGGSLRPVLESARLARRYCHVEITYLLIPGHNDDEDNIAGFAQWVGDNLGNDTPVHFSRYFPSYRLDIPPTPINVLDEARDIASQWLNYVYLGNVDLPGASHTYCPSCGALIIERYRSTPPRMYTDDGTCPKCGQELPIVL